MSKQKRTVEVVRPRTRAGAVDHTVRVKVKVLPVAGESTPSPHAVASPAIVDFDAQTPFDPALFANIFDRNLDGNYVVDSLHMDVPSELLPPDGEAEAYVQWFLSPAADFAKKKVQFRQEMRQLSDDLDRFARISPEGMVKSVAEYREFLFGWIPAERDPDETWDEDGASRSQRAHFDTDAARIPPEVAKDVRLWKEWLVQTGPFWW